jgi:tRNA G10  N-methylase Trm11
LSQIIKPNSVDAIVTEPYLGKPLRGQETKQELASQAKQLKDLYLQAFQQFYLTLKPKGKVVFIIPRFKYANEWVTIDCKNEIEKIGFTALPFFEDQLRLVYARPNQRVAREIWRYTKTPN